MKNFCTPVEGNQLLKRKRVLTEPGNRQKKACGPSDVNVVCTSTKTKAAVQGPDIMRASLGKRKRSKVVDGETGHSLIKTELDAAKALTELFGLVQAPYPVEVGETGIKHVLWSRKRRRSNRRKSESESTIAAAALRNDSGTAHDSLPFFPPRMKVAQAFVTIVKQEEDSESGDKGCLSLCAVMDDDKQLPPASESNHESAQPDSRSESPSSPLPVVRAHVGLIPKVEEGVAARSAFRRVVPLCPVKRPVVSCNLKGEEKFVECYDSMPGKVPAKPAKRRKKPNYSTRLKTEVLDLPTIPSSGGLFSNCAEAERKFQTNDVESAVIDSKVDVKVQLPLVKWENNQCQKLGPLTRQKSAISEVEREARRLRRVQANRESARQTIRRKQVFCEELAAKAAELHLANDKIKQELELVALKHRALLDLNHRLKEQTGKESLQATARPYSTAPPLYPMLPYTGLPMPPPVVWAFALAQAAAASQASAVQAVDQGLAADYNSMAAAFKNNFGFNLWMGGGSTMPPMFPAPPLAPFAGTSAASSSADQQVSISGPSSVPTLPAASTTSVDNVSVSFGTDRSMTPGKADTHSDFIMKSDACFLQPPLEAGVNVHAPQALQSEVSNSMPSVIPLFRMLPPSPGAECRPDFFPSLPLGLTSGNGSAVPIPHLDKLVSSNIFSSYGMGGTGFLGSLQQVTPPKVSGAAVAAAEARRRRKELTRSKSLQMRQGARLANPSAV